MVAESLLCASLRFASAAARPTGTITRAGSLTGAQLRFGAGQCQGSLKCKSEFKVEIKLEPAN